jgi:anti-sigma28 factor (negative regulator of flagellin synthesis)
MSDVSQKPVPETSMNAATQHNRLPAGLGPDTGMTSPAAAARLQAIHDLIRSGNYHVPANAIADRMIERMITDKRRRGY